MKLENKFWKKLKKIGSFFPVINEYNLFSRKSLRKDMPPMGRLFLSGIYILLGSNLYGEVSGQKEFAQQQIELENKVNTHYDSIFKYAKTYEDSLKIWREYQLPLGKDVSFEKKREIYNEGFDKNFKKNNKK